MRPDKRRFHLRVALAFVAQVVTIYLIGVPRTPPGSLPTFRAGEQHSVNVLVRSVSPLTWPSVGDDDGTIHDDRAKPLAKADGAVVTDSPEGKPIYYGLDPGDVAGITLSVNAPATAGEYQLVIDVVQEGVGWFSEKGSKALIQSVSVKH